jgi:glycosyltransferase involved in cell wall biosynthesis
MLVKTPYALSCKDIRDALLKNKAVEELPDDIVIDARPLNLLRNIQDQVHGFKVYSEGTPIFHMEIAKDLSARYHQSKGFNEAFPEISAPPLFYFADTGLEFLGHVHCEGLPLNEALAQGLFKKEKIKESLAQVLSRLTKGECEWESGCNGGITELEQLFENLCSIEKLPLEIRTKLKEEVFPLTEGKLMNRANPRKRWSNGDFIDRNLLIGNGGEITVIDTEFAHETHFPEEDWLRFHAFSILPDEIREVVQKPSQDEIIGTCLYFWLRQLSLENKIRNLSLMPSITHGILKRIFEVSSASQNNRPIQVPTGLKPLSKVEILQVELESLRELYSDCRTHLIRNLREITRIKSSQMWRFLNTIRRVIGLALPFLLRKNERKLHSDFFLLQSPERKFLRCRDGEVRVSGYFADAQGFPAKRIIARIGKRSVDCQDHAIQIVEECPISQECSNLKLGFHARFNIGAGFKLIRFEAETQSGRLVKFGSRIIHNPNSTKTKLKKPAQRLGQNYEFVSRLKSSPIVEQDGKANLNCLDIHWVIPDFAPGAGGHMTIFRTIRHLESLGHKNSLWIMWSSQWGSAEKSKEIIKEHFQDLKAAVHILREKDLDKVTGDVVFATEWRSAYFVRAITNVRKRFYFVQDYEADFFPKGTEYFLAENTLDFGFHCITAGKWLRAVLEKRGLNNVCHFDLAYDSKNYFPPQKARPEAKRIAFYCRSATPRRLTEIGMLALGILAQERSDFQVDIFGEKTVGAQMAFPCKCHGILDAKELGNLYRESTVGIVFSATNYSLIPQEMMACGLPVIEMDGENTRQSFPEGTVSLAHPDPELVAESLSVLLDDSDRRKEQAKQALAHVRQLSWEQSAQQVELSLKEAFSKVGRDS